MSEYYSSLASQANEMSGSDRTVATEPALGFTEGTAWLQGKIDVNFDAIMQAAVDHEKDPNDLNSLGICITTNSGPGFGGGLSKEPGLIDDKIHYPFIRLVVLGKKLPKEHSLNNTLRHEFRHVLQEGKGIDLYNNQLLQTGVNVIGAAMMALAAKHGYDNLVQDPDGCTLAANGGLLLGGAILMVAPHIPLWFMSPAEIDAEVYARRHPSLNPLTVSG